MMKRLGLYKNFSKFLEIIFQAEAAGVGASGF